MKPDYRVFFSEERPTRPGLWLCFRNNMINVLDIQQSDIERDSRDGSWLNGLYAGRLIEVDHEVVPLDKANLAASIDSAISKSTEPGAVAALQELRIALIGAPRIDEKQV